MELQIKLENLLKDLIENGNQFGNNKKFISLNLLNLENERDSKLYLGTVKLYNVLNNELSEYEIFVKIEPKRLLVSNRTMEPSLEDTIKYNYKFHNENVTYQNILPLLDKYFEDSNEISNEMEIVKDNIIRTLKKYRNLNDNAKSIETFEGNVENNERKHRVHNQLEKRNRIDVDKERTEILSVYRNDNKTGRTFVGDEINFGDYENNNITNCGNGMDLKESDDYYKQFERNYIQNQNYITNKKKQIYNYGKYNHKDSTQSVMNKSKECGYNSTAYDNLSTRYSNQPNYKINYYSGHNEDKETLQEINGNENIINTPNKTRLPYSNFKRITDDEHLNTSCSSNRSKTSSDNLNQSVSYLHSDNNENEVNNSYSLKLDEKLKKNTHRNAAKSEITNLFPRFHYGYVSENLREDSVIIIENVLPKGFQIAKEKLYLDEKHIALALQALGKFHAASYKAKYKNQKEFHNTVKNLKPTGWMVPDYWDIYPNFINDHLLRGINHLKTDIKYNPYLFKFEKILRNPKNFFFKLIETNDKMGVVCHGDFCRNNILYKYKNCISQECARGTRINGDEMVDIKKDKDMDSNIIEGMHIKDVINKEKLKKEIYKAAHNKMKNSSEAQKDVKIFNGKVQQRNINCSEIKDTFDNDSIVNRPAKNKNDSEKKIAQMQDITHTIVRNEKEAQNINQFSNTIFHNSKIASRRKDFLKKILENENLITSGVKREIENSNNIENNKIKTTYPSISHNPEIDCNLNKHFVDNNCIHEQKHIENELKPYVTEYNTDNKFPYLVKVKQNTSTIPDYKKNYHRDTQKIYETDIDKNQTNETFQEHKTHLLKGNECIKDENNKDNNEQPTKKFGKNNSKPMDRLEFLEEKCRHLESLYKINDTYREKQQINSEIIEKLNERKEILEDICHKIETICRNQQIEADIQGSIQKLYEIMDDIEIKQIKNISNGCSDSACRLQKLKHKDNKIQADSDFDKNKVDHSQSRNMTTNNVTHIIDTKCETSGPIPAKRTFKEGDIRKIAEIYRQKGETISIPVERYSNKSGNIQNNPCSNEETFNRIQRNIREAIDRIPPNYGEKFNHQNLHNTEVLNQPISHHIEEEFNSIYSETVSMDECTKELNFEEMFDELTKEGISKISTKKYGKSFEKINPAENLKIEKQSNILTMSENFKKSKYLSNISVDNMKINAEDTFTLADDINEVKINKENNGTAYKIKNENNKTETFSSNNTKISNKENKILERSYSVTENIANMPKLTKRCASDINERIITQALISERNIDLKDIENDKELMKKALLNSLKKLSPKYNRSISSIKEYEEIEQTQNDESNNHSIKSYKSIDSIIKHYENHMEVIPKHKFDGIMKRSISLDSKRDHNIRDGLKSTFCQSDDFLNNRNKMIEKKNPDKSKKKVIFNISDNDVDYGKKLDALDIELKKIKLQNRQENDFELDKRTWKKIEDYQTKADDNQVYSQLADTTKILESSTTNAKNATNAKAINDTLKRNTLNNLVENFKEADSTNPIDVVLFDLSRTIYTSPVIDLSVFLFLNTSHELRMKRWNDFIQIYYNSVRNNVPLHINIPNIEDIHEELKKKCVYGYYLCCFFLPWMMEEHPNPNVNEWIHHAGAQGTEAIANIVRFLIHKGYV